MTKFPSLSFSLIPSERLWKVFEDISSELHLNLQQCSITVDFLLHKKKDSLSFSKMIWSHLKIWEHVYTFKGS